MVDARLLPSLTDPDSRPALRFDGRVLTYQELAGATADLAATLRPDAPIAVWATPTLETVVAVLAGLRAGVPVVPLNPRGGERELAHILRDAAPNYVCHAPGTELPMPVRECATREITLSGEYGVPADLPEPAPETPALIVYTSGTTGPPKGVVLPRRAISSNLDALAAAWNWTDDDVVAHALPLFHVHGLILGVLGPVRLGGAVHHLGRFSPEAVAAALTGPATMLFAVPTMYHRLADAAESDPAIARALGRARLLVSGSAALTRFDHDRIAAATGQRIVERYGMTETLMNCAVRADGDRRPGTVGPPVDGVRVEVVGEDDLVVPADGETIGETIVQGPNLFLGYLNQPEATAAALRDGWFRTGDLAVREPDGYVRIVGRTATDIIKSGGYKIGAGEIENVLLEHPGVAEVAVTGAPDPDLGERVVAWIVPAPGDLPREADLAEQVAVLLAPHKRPREFHFVERLPRNEMGKVLKRSLIRPEVRHG